MPRLSFNVGVIGAGIGGLALSILLKKNNWNVTVFERSQSISELGAGVQLSPNGIKVLRSMGIENEISQVASSAERIVLKRGLDDKFITQISLGSTATKRYGASFLQIHRSDLINILYKKACELGVNFLFGNEAVAKPSKRNSSEIHCDKNIFNFDVVVGADGIHSITRKNFFQFAEPKFLNQIAYRATLSLDQIDDVWRKQEIQVLVGPGRHIVIYPLISKSLLNMVFCSDEKNWTCDGWSNIAEPIEVTTRFENFFPVNDILNQITSVHKWGLLGYENRRNWHVGNLALLGDSCHPMLPYLAQGANQALEDAASLEYFLRPKSAFNIFEALEFYSEFRRDRVLKVQKFSSRNAKLYHLSNGPATALKHKALNLVSRVLPNFLLGRFDWLYNYETPR